MSDYWGGDDGDQYGYDDGGDAWTEGVAGTEYSRPNDVSAPADGGGAGVSASRGDSSAHVYGTKQTETVSRDVVFESLMNDVHKFADFFSLSNPAAAALLDFMGWPLDPADYFLTHREEVVKGAGLKEDGLMQPPHSMIANEAELVDMCVCAGDPIAPGDGLAFSTCHHFAHRECWQQHLRARATEGSIFKTRCMMCRELIGVEDLPSLCRGADESFVSTVKRAYLSSYTLCHPRFSVCISDTCDGVVHLLRALPEDVSVCCDLCHSEWCRSCRASPHHPARCTSLLEWTTSNVEEGASLAFIQQATKPCPKCHRPIQKNSGCNHMTCTAPCKYEFCWICMGDWRQHTGSGAYNCAQPPSVVVDNSTKRLKEDLLTFHYNIITSLKQSAATEKRTITNFLSQEPNEYAHLFEPIFRRVEKSLYVARSLAWNGHIESYIQKIHLLDAGKVEESKLASDLDFRCGRVKWAAEEMSKSVDKCIGTKVSPGVLRGKDVDPVEAENGLRELQEHLAILERWCKSVESDD